jgi:hypothetical protein
VLMACTVLVGSVFLLINAVSRDNSICQACTTRATNRREDDGTYAGEDSTSESSDSCVEMGGKGSMVRDYG